jgi:hypothetical protein
MIVVEKDAHLVVIYHDHETAMPVGQAVTPGVRR